MIPAPSGSPLRLIPLGGLGEFGLNSLVLEWEGHLLLVDAGLLFPSAEMPGVDSVVPDFAYLAERRDALRGIVLTHGHEDHIGALGWALEAAPAPVFATPLTLGLAKRRLVERGIRPDTRHLVPGSPVDIGPFCVHPIRVAHSVLDAVALAIETPAGVVVVSGDFKIDATAPDTERTDTESLAAWGRRGVLALLADSTNVENEGFTAGEEAVIPAFEAILERTPGRVLVSCFATSIPRMQRVADLAIRSGRSVTFAGRRMVENAETAMNLGLLRIPTSSLVAVDNLAASSDGDRVLAFVSGSQGEPMSALSSIAMNEHRNLELGPGDTVVLSARSIPGNERVVSRLISNLFRRGADVVHPGLARVHVSGHGNRGDLGELIRLTSPRYFVPVHGEYRMLTQHARLAVEAGVDAERILVAEDGDVLELSSEGIRRADRIPAGRILVDRGASGEIDDLVVRDRRHISSEGIVVPIVVLDRTSGALQSPPEIVSRGLPEAEFLGAEMALRVEEVLAARPAGERLDPASTRERLRLEIRRLIKRRTDKRPLVIPVVLEV